MSDPSAIRSSHRGRSIRTLAVTLALVAVAAGCVQPVYEETPIPTVPSTSPIPTAIPAVAPTSPVPTPTPDVTGPVVLRMKPSTMLDLTVGETRAVEVWLESIEGLHGIELHIVFEPLYLQIEDADPDAAGVQIAPGEFPTPSDVLRNEVDNDAGVIVYHVAQEPGELARGSGLVASFTLRGQAQGGSPLHFNIVTLLGAERQPLPEPEQTIDGLISIGPAQTPVEPTDEATAAPGADTPTPTTTPPPTPSPSPTPASEGVYHTVQPGENLYRISLQYDTTIPAIVAANDLPDADSVQAGQKLYIPLGAAARSVTYVVKPGDTLYSIARRFGTTVGALATHNGIAPPYTIKAGQTLIIVP